MARSTSRSTTPEKVDSHRYINSSAVFYALTSVHRARLSCILWYREGEGDGDLGVAQCCFLLLFINFYNAPVLGTIKEPTTNVGCRLLDTIKP